MRAIFFVDHAWLWDQVIASEWIDQNKEFGLDDVFDDPIECAYRRSKEWHRLQRFCRQQLASEPEDEFELENPDEFEPPRNLWQGWRTPDDSQAPNQELNIHDEIDLLKHLVEQDCAYSLIPELAKLQFDQLIFGKNLTSLCDEQTFGVYQVIHSVDIEDEGQQILELDFIASSKAEALMLVALYYQRGAQRLWMINDIRFVGANKLPACLEHIFLTESVLA